MKHPLSVLFVVLIAILTAGCASSPSGDTYSREEARRVMTVQEGTLTAVRKVKLEGTNSGVGTIGGAVVGGVGGSTVGQGKGAVIATVVGAVVGGIVGAAAEEGMTRDAAWELTIKLDSGKSIVVVQAQGQDLFVAGERVRVLQADGTTRISH